MKTNKSMFAMTVSMLIFGSIGIVRRYIPLPSGTIALARGIIGALFLGIVIIISNKISSFKNIKGNLPMLMLSGAFIGFNWILLFEAYNYTTVSIATLCYYMAPVIVILLSPIFLKERLTLIKFFCIIAAIVGTVFISNANGNDKTSLLGVIFGLSAAVLYALIIIMNKKISNVDPLCKTAVQLTSASIVLLPYVLIVDGVNISNFTFKTVILLLVVGIVYTGLAYFMYFGAIDKLKAQTVALLSYIDPITAIALSAFILNEKMTVFNIVGAVLILGAIVLDQFFSNKKERS